MVKSPILFCKQLGKDNIKCKRISKAFGIIRIKIYGQILIGIIYK